MNNNDQLEIARSLGFIDELGVEKPALPDAELLDMSIVLATKLWENSPQVIELTEGARVARQRLEVLFYFQDKMFRELDAAPWILATMRAVK